VERGGRRKGAGEQWVFRVETATGRVEFEELRDQTNQLRQPPQHCRRHRWGERVCVVRGGCLGGFLFCSLEVVVVGVVVVLFGSFGGGRLFVCSFGGCFLSLTICALTHEFVLGWSVVVQGVRGQCGVGDRKGTR
jgi:hypothetical protein